MPSCSLTQQESEENNVFICLFDSDRIMTCAAASDHGAVTGTFYCDKVLAAVVNIYDP